tara:strand:+ start:22681 stop:23766 length:1086 start_codon:yes stop_codon:yes gene_type:complete
LTTLTIKSNPSTIDDVLIKDMGESVPPGGNSISISNQDSLELASSSKRLRELCNDGAFSGANTLIISIDGQNVSPANVDIALKTVPVSGNGPYSVVTRDDLGDLSLNQKIEVQNSGSPIITDPDQIDFISDLLTASNPSGNKASVDFGGTLAQLNAAISDATLDDASSPRDPNPHSSTHVLGGSDAIDGDQLGIDFTPVWYSPNTSPGEVSNPDHLSAHLKGLDDLHAHDYASSEGESSTTSTTWQTKVTMTDTYPAGEYIFEWSCEISASAASDTMCQARLFDVTSGVEVGMAGVPGFLTNVTFLLVLRKTFNQEYVSVGGVAVVNVSGTHQMQIQFRREPGRSGTAFIRRARIYAHRVG